MNQFAPIFVSHGSPMLAVEPGPASDFLRGLGRTLGRPRAILVLSAHWETEMPTVSAAAHPATIYDFNGFPEVLYRLQYPAPGAPELALAVVQQLDAAGISARTHPTRGLDHGAWVPLRLIYPEADIPVTQLSIQAHLGPAHHLALGKALAPLQEQGVFILASGSATHNLGELRGRADGEIPEVWVVEFDHWLTGTLQREDTEALLRYRTLAPHAVRNHPTEEHLLPLFVALGAGGTPALLHTSYTHRVLSMAVYAFGLDLATPTL